LFTIRICLLLLLALTSFAQAPPPAPAKPDANQQPPTPERRITPAEAKELLNAVDEVLEFDSGATGLRIKHEIKRQLADREQVQKYIESRLKDDEDTQRLRHSEVVLKKLGLLPRDFDLQTFLVQMLREQVAGYYDTKTKTVYLLDWLPPAQQLPVLAHELTHALQDQNFGLEKWIGRGTSEKTPTEEARGDEEIAARHAVIEGQAMAAMIDYLLAPTGNSVVNSPMITEAIQQGMAESADSPVFNRAPLFLKRVMLFPYREGLNFERELLVKGGKEKAYAGVFKSPPLNTRQLMEPATYLAGEKLPDLPVPNLAKLLGKEWENYDVGSIGEFDVAVMTEIYSGEEKKNIYPQWRGGWYYTMKRKDGGELALVMATKWANVEARNSFFHLYESSVAQRYPGAKNLADRITGPTYGGMNADSSWLTSQGPVCLLVSDDLVIAIESVPADLIEKIRSVVVGK